MDSFKPLSCLQNQLLNGKVSYVSRYRKQGRKKFPVRSSLRTGRLARELAKLKVETRVFAKSLKADKKAARQTEAEYAFLTATTNETINSFIKAKKKLLEMQAAEAFLMHKLDMI